MKKPKPQEKIYVVNQEGQSSGDAPSELSFPVECNLRIIAESRAAECRMELEKVFHRFGFHLELGDGAASSGGRYVTYTAQLEIPSRLVLEELPQALSEVEGVRIVL